MGENEKVDLTLYNKIKRVRDFLLQPIVHVIFGRLPPSVLSYSGVLMMVFFIFSVPQKLAFVFLGLSILIDMMDGVLARDQGHASDQGKFVDMVCDNLSFTLFVIGLIHAGLLAGVVGALLIYVMAASKVLRSIHHNNYLKSKWKFKAVAGFFPNLIVGLSYVIFAIEVIFGIKVIETASIFSFVFLALDSTHFYLKVLNTK
jgi:phosphatidylglycerophosphate synthase